MEIPFIKYVEYTEAQAQACKLLEEQISALFQKRREQKRIMLSEIIGLWSEFPVPPFGNDMPLKTVIHTAVDINGEREFCGISFEPLPGKCMIEWSDEPQISRTKERGKEHCRQLGKCPLYESTEGGLDAILQDFYGEIFEDQDLDKSQYEKLHKACELIEEVKSELEKK